MSKLDFTGAMADFSEFPDGRFCAEVYGVDTETLVETVKRCRSAFNPMRTPEDLVASMELGAQYSVFFKEGTNDIESVMFIVFGDDGGYILPEVEVEVVLTEDEAAALKDVIDEERLVAETLGNDIVTDFHHNGYRLKIEGEKAVVTSYNDPQFRSSFSIAEVKSAGVKVVQDKPKTHEDCER